MTTKLLSVKGTKLSFEIISDTNEYEVVNDSGLAHGKALMELESVIQ